MNKPWLALILIFAVGHGTPTFADLAVVKHDGMINAEQNFERINSPYIALTAPEGWKLSEKQANRISMMVVAGLVAYQGIADDARLHGKTMSALDQASLIANISKELVGGGEMFVAVHGGAFASKAGEPLTRMIMQKGGATMVSSFVARVVAQSISKSLMLGGSIAAIHLWEAAIKRQSPEDQAKGQNWIDSIIKVVRAKDPQEKVRVVADDARVFAQIGASMVKIAVIDPDARNLWAYDTWRNGIATGTFLTSTAGLAGGAAVGGTVGSAVPVVGTGVGAFVGGLVGVGVSIGLLPDSVNATISEKEVQLREHALETKLDSCMERAKMSYRLSENPSYNKTYLISDSSQVHWLEACGKIRENLMTIKMDRLVKAYSQMRIAQNRRDISHLAGVTDSENEMADFAIKSKARLQKVMSDTLDFYAKQQADFIAWAPRLKNSVTHQLVLDEASRVAKVEASLKATYSGVPEDKPSVLQILAASETGFYESDWLEPVTPMQKPTVPVDCAPTASH